MSSLQSNINTMLITNGMQVIEYNRFNEWNSRTDFHPEQYSTTKRIGNRDETNIHLHSDESSTVPQQKTKRDPQSHRVIEKRRRDRMNKCLQDLSRLVPQTFTKKSKTRVEKTEIIEMAIKYLKHLNTIQKNHLTACREEHKKQFQMGYQECMSETIRFLVEVEEMTFKEGLCMRIVSHLQNHVSNLSHLENVPPKLKSNGVNQAIPLIAPTRSRNDRDSKPEPPKGKLADQSQSQDMFRSKSSTYTCTSSSSNSDKSRTSRKYKFKQNMKERFQADIKKDDGKGMSSENASNLSTIDLSPSENRCSNESSSSDSSFTTSLSGGSNSDVVCNQKILNDCRREASRKDGSPNLLLPGFVLHPSETYYIPIRLDISPSIPILKENIAQHSLVNLYPVNITVNFCYSLSPFDVQLTFVDPR